MNTLQIFGLTMDLSGVETDGERWCGKVVIIGKASTVTATWLGYAGVDDGELTDIEGENQSFCLFVESNVNTFCVRIAEHLGMPSDSDGRAEMWAAIEEARQVHERMVGT